MMSQLEEHLQRIDSRTEADFRWVNLRKLVLSSLTGKRILDAGCGTGHMTGDLLRQGFSVISLDCSLELAAFTKMNCQSYSHAAQVVCGDLASGCFREHSFDSVICLDVIEHCERDDEVLKTCYRILKPGGMLILSVPAVSWLFGERDRKIGHFRRYDKGDLVIRLRSSGFTVQDIRYWNGIGLVYVFLYEKLFHQTADDSLRYSGNRWCPVCLNTLLDRWFSLVENHIRFPLGLTIFVIGRKNS
jgi:SAM-dependent methyltransferase